MNKAEKKFCQIFKNRKKNSNCPNPTIGRGLKFLELIEVRRKTISEKLNDTNIFETIIKILNFRNHTKKHLA